MDARVVVEGGQGHESLRVRSAHQLIKVVYKYKLIVWNYISDLGLEVIRTQLGPWDGTRGTVGRGIFLSMTID
nr:hypothetical protein Itr_chr12CG06320 [Ipomoea trifida]